MPARFPSWALSLAAALALGAADAAAAVPAGPRATETEIGEARRVLDANGYSDISVVSSDDRMVTVSARKDGARRIVDVDPMTGIILPHVDVPPIVPARPAPVTGSPTNPR